MRNITLYTDTPVGEHIMKKFKLAVIDQGDEVPNGNSAYTFTSPGGIAAFERALESDAPSTEYTIVVDKRVQTYKYLLIEMPAVTREEFYHQYVDTVISFAEQVFGAVSVGEVTSLPDKTPEQILSIVIGEEEDTDE